MLNLVTGATGTIGSHLVETLIVRGESVRALVRPTSRSQRLRELDVDIRMGNLRDNATLMSAVKGVDRVYHCAGLVNDWGVRADFDLANVAGVSNVLAAATRANVTKFIHLSTSDVYGFPGRPVDESERPSPRGFPYADSKIEGESRVMNHFRRGHLSVCILRPATIYGPRARLSVVTLVQALRRRRLVLIDDGRHVAGLTYVGNLVDAMVLAADSDASTGQAYNISDGSLVTWKEYVSALANVTQVPAPTRNRSHTVAYAIASLWELYYQMSGRNENPPHTRMLVELMGTDQHFPIDKAQRELGYRPRVGLEEGMRHTAHWLNATGLLD